MSPDTTPIRDSRWPALYVLCLGVLMIVLDATIVNVALPSIQEDLGFSQASLAWVVNSYLIALGGLLLLAGRLGDLIGRRSVFMAGLVLFTAGSLWCGLAQSAGMLVVARFVQGAGGALASAVVLGMIVTMFPEPREQAKAIGVYGFVATAGASIGLLAGGALTESINWHWIFFVNIPIGVATVVAATRLIERDPGIGLRRGADVPGAVLITAALMLLVYTIVEPAAQSGWADGGTLALFAVCAVLFAGFIAREATARTPMMPLGVFRSRSLSGANAVQAFSCVGMFGMFFIGALYVQTVLGFDALETGLAFLPSTIVMGVLSLRYTERLITRFGATGILVPGLVLIAAGLALFMRAPVDGTFVEHLLPVMVLLGAGAGLCFPALMTVAMSGTSPEEAGLASGLINTTAQVGGALGLAVLATVSAGRTESLVANGAGKASALVDGYQLAYGIGAGMVALAVVVALVVLVPEGRAASAREARCDAAEPACSAA